MTTDIRDGVVWKPWWVRYAEFEGRAIWLSDLDAVPVRPLCPSRYGIALALETDTPCSRARCGCGLETRHGDTIWLGNDLDEALAAFHETEERLLRGEL